MNAINLFQNISVSQGVRANPTNPWTPMIRKISDFTNVRF